MRKRRIQQRKASAYKYLAHFQKNSRDGGTDSLPGVEIKNTSIGLSFVSHAVYFNQFVGLKSNGRHGVLYLTA